MDELIKLKNIAEQAVADYLKLASNCYQKDLLIDNVSFDLKGQAAGQFVVKKKAGKVTSSIRLNTDMLLRYGYEFIDEVIPHECAHLVVFFVYGQRSKGGFKKPKPHGKEWKEVMSLFGRKPKVRHNFEVPSRVQKRFKYSCGCLGKVHELTIIRHNKIVKKGTKYQCKVCSQILEHKETK